MQIKKIDAVNFIMVLAFTPFATLTLFFSFLKSSRISIFLYSLFVALISYSYKPYAGYDKTRHYEMYNYVKTLSFTDFWGYVTSFSPDFLFYLLLHFAGKLGISFHHVVFLCTFVTIFLIFFVLNEWKCKVGMNRFWNVIMSIMVLCSVYYLDVFSGIRFYLAASFFLYGLHLLSKGKVFSIFFLFLSAITHFSIILVLPLCLFCYSYKFINFSYLKIAIVLSLGLSFLLPYSVQLFSGFGGALGYKIQAYLFVESQVVESVGFARKLFDFINIFWFYVLNIYCLFFLKKNKSMYCYIMVVTLCLSNVFILFPDVFTRYALLVRVFLILFIFDRFLDVHGSVKVLFLCLLLSSTLSQVLVIFPSLWEASFGNLENSVSFIRLIQMPYTFEDIK